MFSTGGWRGVPTRLKIETGAIALVFAVSLVLFLRFLDQKQLVVNLLLSAFLGVATFLYLILLFVRNLHKNHRADETDILPSFGSGNFVTILRGLLTMLLVTFLFSPLPSGRMGWLPALLFTTIAIVDIFDGYVARRANHATELGGVLDIEIDALSVLVVIVLGIGYGNMPAFFLALGLARYAFIWGQRWREKRGKPISPMTHSVYRRICAGLYMGFLTVMVYPIVHPPGTWVAGAAFTLPFAGIFLRDWFVVSQTIDPRSVHYRTYWTQPTQLLVRWLPVALRLVCLFIIIFGWQQGVTPDWSGFLSLVFWATVVPPPFVLGLLHGLTWLMTLFVIAGILPRFTTIWLILVATVTILTTGLNWLNGILLFSSCLITVLGHGTFAWWSPEEGILYRRRLGEN